MRINSIGNILWILFIFAAFTAQGQITLNTNFQVNSNQPIDTRDTLTALSDTSLVSWTYPGLLTYVASEDAFWYYTGTQWRLLLDGTTIPASAPDSITVYAPSHGLTDTIALYGYVPVQADFTRANSTSADSVFIAYAIDAPDSDSLTLVFSGVLVYGSWHGKAINVQYYLQDDGSEDITPGTVSMPTAIASDSTTIFLREVGVDIAGRLRRIAMPSPLITAFGGNPASPTDAVVQAAIEGAYLPAGLAQPGTIFTLSYATQSYNPSYQQTAPNTNPLTPSYAWLWDGVYATRIVNIPTSVDLEDTAYGVLGTLTLIPVSSLGSVPPTDSIVAMWLDTNYTANGLRLANGSLLYYIDSGTRQNPDYIWQVIDDVSYDAGDTDWEKIIKRVYSPSAADGNGLFDAASNNDTIRVSNALLKAAFQITGGTNGVTVTRSASSAAIVGNNASSGAGVNGVSTTGYGVQAQSGLAAGYFNSTSANTGLIASSNGSAATDTVSVIRLDRNTSEVVAPGFGANIRYDLEASDGNRYISTLLQSKWTDVTPASRTSRFEWWLANNGSLVKRMQLAGTGQLTLSGYAANALNNPDSSLYVMAVDATGDVHTRAASGLGGDGNGIFDAANEGSTLGVQEVYTGSSGFYIYSEDINSFVYINNDGAGPTNAIELRAEGGGNINIGVSNADIEMYSQVMSLTADTLDATGVTTFLGFPGGSQTLSTSNDSLTISGGNTVKLPITELLRDSVTTTTMTVNLETRYQKVVQIDMTSATNLTLTINNPTDAGVYTFHFLGVSGTDNVTWPAAFYDANNTALGTDALTSGTMYTCYYSSADVKYFCK